MNQNHRSWKWITGILGALLVVAITSLISNIRNTAVTLEGLQLRQERMGEDVRRNAQWISDWYAVLRVPERDQQQDSAIEDILRRLELIGRR